MKDPSAGHLRQNTLLQEAIDAEGKGFLIKACAIFRSLSRAARKPEDRATLAYLIARTSVTADRPQIHAARKRLQSVLAVLSKETAVPFPLNDQWHPLTAPLVASLDAFLLFQLRQEQDAYRRLRQLEKGLPPQDAAFEDRYGRAQIHHNSALVCVKLQKFDEAHEHFKHALQGYSELGMDHALSRVADGLGTLLGMIGKYREARLYLELSLAIKQRFKDLRGQSISLGNLSRVAVRGGDLPAARRHAARVLAISRQAQDARGISVGLIYLGDVERFQGQDLMEIASLLPRSGRRRTQTALKHFLRARNYYLEACARGLDPVYRMNAEIGLAFVHHFLGSREASARSLKEARHLYAGQQGRYPEIEEWIQDCTNLLRSESYAASSLAKVSESVRSVVSRQRQVLELESAKRVQDKLLPPAGAEIAGAKIEFLFIPASETSGDFYDFGPIPQNGGYALVGDVTGHGAEAAMLMMPVVVGFREKHDLGLRERLAHLNHLLAHHLSTRHFVTLCVMKWEKEFRMAGLVNAGHPSPIRISAKGTAEYIPTTQQPALGVDEDHVYKTDLVSIRSGDRILFYTDGLAEARNEKGEMFEKKMLAEISRCAKQKSKAFLPSLHTALKDHCRGQALDDDLTLLIILFS